jgi:hypothetical protein
MKKASEKKAIFWIIIFLSVFFMVATIAAKAFSATQEYTILAEDNAYEIRLLFPETGGCFVCFSEADRIYLIEDDLPLGFSELGVKELYNNRPLMVVEAENGSLQSDDPLIQDFLDRLELVE